MRFEAGNALRTNHCIMHGIRWQIESVTSFERKLLTEFR
jgi:hypothetical protein